MPVCDILVETGGGGGGGVSCEIRSRCVRAGDILGSRLDDPAREHLRSIHQVVGQSTRTCSLEMGSRSDAPTPFANSWHGTVTSRTSQSSSTVVVSDNTRQ